MAVNVITTFIDHLLDTRLRLSSQVESTKFHTAQRHAVITERICYVIELLADQQKLSARTDHSGMNDRNRFGLNTKRFVVFGEPSPRSRTA